MTSDHTSILQKRFPALSYPNYRLWFMGQIVSLFGTWMQMTAQGYLIYELTHSSAYLGYVSFAGGIGPLVLTLYGGVVADRMPRRTLLIITQVIMMLLALILAALTLLHLVQPWHIIVLAFCLGVANAFDMPARQAFVLEMVDRQDLTNAIVLNAAMFNTANALGPAAAGLTYAAFGPGWCFLLNGLSFLTVIAALIMMKLKPWVAPVRRGSTLAELAEGLRYTAANPTIRMLILLVAVVTVFGMSFATLLPAWAVRILGGDATTNGAMQSARGVGALISALTIASLGRFRFKGKIVTLASLLYPLTLLAFSATRALPLSLLFLVGTGLAHIPIVNLSNALVQGIVPDNMRGRVMSVFALGMMGMFPIGGLWAGTLAQHLGEPTTIVIGACIVLLVAVAIRVLLPRLWSLE